MHIVKWLHPVAMDFVGSTSPNTAWIGGRGTSKTHATAYRLLRIIPTMPRGKGFMLGPTIKQLEMNEIPTLFEVWEGVGLYRYTPSTKLEPHKRYFTYGINPPAGWYRPPAAPDDYSNVLAFPNGCTVVLMGARVGDTIRGGTYDFSFIQEAGFINGNRYTQVYRPMVRGPKNKVFSLGAGHPESRSPYYLSCTFTSSRPTTASGRWVSDNMEKLANQDPRHYKYLESDIYANLPLYGLSYIEQIKQEICAINPIIWEVEYMNRNYTRPPNAYYHKFSESTHTYANYLQSGYLESVSYDPYYTAAEPIALSFDFNSYIVSCTAHQITPQRIVTLSEFYGLRENADPKHIIDQFAQKYANHITKVVHLYGDSTPSNQYTAKDYNNVYDGIVLMLQKKGWRVLKKVRLGFNPEHQTRQQIINRALSGDMPLSILINADECPYTIKSIMLSPMHPDFRKDKSAEKKPNEIDPRIAPHLSDTCDYLYYEILKDLEAASKSFKASALA